MNEIQREIAPPDDLEQRVVSELRARGLIGARPRRVRRFVVAAAAAILCFVAGYGAAKWSPGGEAIPTPAGLQFMLLLHDTDAFTSRGIPEDRLVAEYGRWARGVHAKGHAIHGEKLKDMPGQTLSGFFIVAAPTLDEAQAIADSCPHVQYGGRIEVRQIDPT
jgi:hypothetical protein